MIIHLQMKIVYLFLLKLKSNLGVHLSRFEGIKGANYRSLGDDPTSTICAVQFYITKFILQSILQSSNLPPNIPTILLDAFQLECFARL